jgi:hypothetical protein
LSKIKLLTQLRYKAIVSVDPAVTKPDVTIMLSQIPFPNS